MLFRSPTYYAYTAPEPSGLRDTPLAPGAAHWVQQGSGSIALLPYETVRNAADPERVLLAFLQSAYLAGATTSGYDTGDLTSSWCPAPTALEDLLG